jgi:hypothetical protein
MQHNLPKSTQNCQILPNFASFVDLWNTPKNWDFLSFSKIKTYIRRRTTKVCGHLLDFQYKFFDVPFILSKNCLYMWISTYPLVENNFFLNVSCLLRVWDFVDIYLTQPKSRTWSPTTNIYYKKRFLGTKLWHLIRHRRKRHFHQLWMLQSRKR